MPAPLVTGVRFAFEPGVGRAAVPVRSALSGTVIAVAMVVATLTFAASLQTLVSHPRLYGWNWDYEINPSNEVPPQTRAMLTSDPDVAGWSGASEIIVEIDGQSVPALLADPGATVAPPILSGHGVDATSQIVLGAATLARLHKHVGQTVTVSYGKPEDAPAYVPPFTMHIVGSATFPAVGFASFVADHTSMGTGALVSTLIQPARFRKAQLSTDPNLNGPDMVFVRVKPGVSAARAREPAADRAGDRQGDERRPAGGRQQRESRRRATARPDRELSQHRQRAGAPGDRARGGRGVRAVPHSHRGRCGGAGVSSHSSRRSASPGGSSRRSSHGSRPSRC